MIILGHPCFSLKWECACFDEQVDLSNAFEDGRSYLEGLEADRVEGRVSKQEEALAMEMVKERFREEYRKVCRNLCLTRGWLRRMTNDIVHDSLQRIGGAYRHECQQKALIHCSRRWDGARAINSDSLNINASLRA